jgi:hypothetical protein
MTASLVIAPQWIGDAVMTEPLLRVLTERGETLTVAAMPWGGADLPRHAAGRSRHRVAVFTRCLAMVGTQTFCTCLARPV